MNNRPIGVFDSGLGGLTVVKEIKKILPHEDIIYLGDTARVPYGTRSKETVTKFSMEDANFLDSKKVKCIVIACNTASAMAGATLKKHYKTPVFDVITPALLSAKSISKNGKIGVIGTRGTIGSGAYKVSYSVACPLFVPFIEEGEIKGKAIELIAKKYLSQFAGTKIDTLIIGCTHYPIIKNIIKKYVDHNKIKIVDPAESLARDLFKYLNEYKLMNSQTKSGVIKYFVTDFTQRFVKIAEMFLGHTINDNLKKVNL